MDLPNVQLYGAKGAMLEYVRKHDGAIPIEPYVLVPVGDNWHKYSREISKLGPCLVRSSSTIEDGEQRSFAGLFDTTPFTGEESVNKVLNSVRNPAAIQYARNHRINIPEKIGLVFHKISPSNGQWNILRHPHKQNILFIQGRVNGITKGYVFDEHKENAYATYDYELNMAHGTMPSNTTRLPQGVEQAIIYYKRIEQLPVIKRRISNHHVECGIDTFSFYQARPFRKKSTPTWQLNPVRAKNDEKIHRYGIAFGITPEEGIELTGLRIDIASTTEEIIRASRLLHTGILQEDVRARHTKGHSIDIDLLCPSAHAWVCSNGREFLSHDLFRPAQSYDTVLLGQNIPEIKTGTKVHIYSDGIRGMVVEKR